MIVSSVVDLRVRMGIVSAHAGRLDKVASWAITTTSVCIRVMGWRVGRRMRVV
jgi:hypothetical protein